MPATLKIEKLLVGPISAARAAWTEALGKVKLPQANDATSPADTLDIVDERGAAHRLALSVSSEAAHELTGDPAGAGILSPAGPYVQQLHGRPLAEQAQVALVAAAAPGAGDPAFFDVAACLAGETPAWTGGPLTWLWSEQSEVLAQLDVAGCTAWKQLETTFRHVCS